MPIDSWKSLAFTGGNPQPAQSISAGINIGRDPIHGPDWGQSCDVNTRSKTEFTLLGLYQGTDTKDGSRLYAELMHEQDLTRLPYKEHLRWQ